MKFSKSNDPVHLAECERHWQSSTYTNAGLSSRRTQKANESLIREDPLLTRPSCISIWTGSLLRRLYSVRSRCSALPFSHLPETITNLSRYLLANVGYELAVARPTMKEPRYCKSRNSLVLGIVNSTDWDSDDIKGIELFTEDGIFFSV